MDPAAYLAACRFVRSRFLFVAKQILHPLYIITFLHASLVASSSCVGIDRTRRKAKIWTALTNKEILWRVEDSRIFGHALVVDDVGEGCRRRAINWLICGYVVVLAGHGRRALEDRVRAVQGRRLRQEAGAVRATQGAPVAQGTVCPLGSSDLPLRETKCHFLLFYECCVQIFQAVP